MNIEKVVVKKDPNGKWDMEVHVDACPSISKKEIHRHENQRFHYGEDENGIVTFGVSYDTPFMGHKPGYMWSSRPSVFNTMFDMELIEITLCTPNDWHGYTRWGCYSMTVDKAIELLPNNFNICMFDAHGENLAMLIENNDSLDDIEQRWGYKFQYGFLVPIKEDE